MNRQDVNREVQSAFGFIPAFINQVPDQHVGPLWEEMRKLQLEQGVIPAKYQQLIMLAVSTYAKCKYCTDYHTEFARTLGASKEEIAECALLVGHTAQWSNILGGIQHDFEQWKRDVRKACDAVAKMGNGGRAQQPRA